MRLSSNDQDDFLVFLGGWTVSAATTRTKPMRLIEIMVTSRLYSILTKRMRVIGKIRKNFRMELSFFMYLSNPLEFSCLVASLLYGNTEE